MKHNNTSKDKIRNIGICAHIDAGKTTVSERILFYAGRIHSLGEVHEGDTVMDDDPLEQAKGITINSAATTVYWPDNSNSINRINLIDTPGHIDFTVEVERSLRVLDGAVCVIDGSQGVEPQTEQVWRQADRYNVARIIFVNKMDKAGADYQMSLDSLSEKLGIKAIAIQFPAGEESEFSGIVDLVNWKFITFDEQSLGKKYQIKEIPPELLQRACSLKEQMIESLSEIDDVICEKFLQYLSDGDNSTISTQEIKQALRKGTINRNFFPVLCGSALKNKGVQMLLDAIIDYLPSPLDLPAVTGIHPKSKEEVTRKLSNEEPLSALVFKIVNDDNGNLIFVRVYSGVLNSGTYLYNSTRGRSERASRVLLMHASKKEPIDSAESGTIAAIVGLKNSYTGDTLCDEKNPILLEKIDFPDPVVELSVEPKTTADQDKLAIGLQKMLMEDPSLKVATDPETGQTILKGMGELHLEIVVARLLSNHNVNVNTGKPRVSYKETITRENSAEHKHWTHNGGKGIYGHVVLNITPGARGSGFVFNSEIVGGSIPKEFIPAVEKGVKEAMQRGVYSSNPMVDVEVTLIDGSTHSVDGCALGFELAASKAFQQAALAAGPTILEPIMSVEVTAPEQFMGAVIGVISSRSGQIKNTSIRGNARVVEAAMPLRRLFSLTGELRGETQGRAVPSVRFSRYEICSLKPSELK